MPEGSDPLERALEIGPRAEMLAKRLGLNSDSPTTRQLLQHLDMVVDEFISTFRVAKIRAEFPAEFLPMHVEEALLSRDSTVRKLLVDRRFAK